jgi:predicted phosphoribosyltransferase
VAYRDRTEAGRVLASSLAHLKERHPLVMGIPRGGVPVAAEVAASLGGDLDVAVAHKLGTPGNPELAMGAVAEDGVPLLDEGLIRSLRVSEEAVAAEIDRQVVEVERRLDRYRSGRPAPGIAGRTVIVVDDGVATGATLTAVLRSLRAAGPDHLVCAVPVGPEDTLIRLEREADEVVCPLRPPLFFAVGEWYRDFGQTTDDEVIYLLGLS